MILVRLPEIRRRCVVLLSVAPGAVARLELILSPCPPRLSVRAVLQHAHVYKFISVV